MTPKILLTYLLVLLFTSPLQAQSDKLPVYHYPYKLYSIQDGLSQTQCMSIFQDSKGFIWVGTMEGINRFDGLEFTNYKTDTIFPKGYIKEIEEDREGNIWFISETGIYKYDWDTIYNYLPNIPVKISPTAIQYDPVLNQFWIKAEKDAFLILGLLSMDGNFEDVTSRFLNSNEVIDNIIYDKICKRLLAVAKDTVLKSCNIYSIKNKKRELLTTVRGSYYYLSKNDKEEIFITTDDSIFKLEQDNSFTFISKKPCKDCFISGTDKFVVANYKNLFIRTPSSWVNSGIKFYRVNKWLISKNGNFWAASEEGLIKVFNTPFHIYPQDRGMIGNVWDINEGKDNKIWFASYGFGLSYLNGNTYTYYTPKENDDKRRYLYMGGITTSKGDILFSDQFNILLYEPLKDFRELKWDKKEMPVMSMYEDTLNNRILLGTDGLKIIEDNKLIKFYRNEDSLDIATFKYIVAIEKDKNGIFWLGSSRGLSKFDGKNFQNFYPPQYFKRGVISIHRDYKDNLWFGTRDGLLFYDYSNEMPVPIFENEIKEVVSFVTSIDSSFLIIGIRNKLFVLDLKRYYEDQRVFQYLDYDNGFTGGEVGQNGVLIDQKKTAWIATTNNVIRFFPKQLKFDTVTPSVFLSKLEIFKFGSSEMTHAFNLFTQKDTIVKINSKETHVKFYFLSTCEESPSKVEYQYTLLGFDTTWSAPTNNRFVSYTNLPIGKFTFHVKACKHGRCSEPKSIRIEVYPANFWEKNLIKNLLSLKIYIIGIFILWMLIIGYILYRKNVLKLKHQLGVLKLENIHNQIEPHFFFNALRSISDLVGTAQKNFIAGIGQMLRPVINKDDKNIMRTLTEEIAYVETYIELENIKFENRINLTVQIANDVNLEALVPKTLIQTFVNNAVKHGLEAKKGGEVKVIINQNIESISISIEDNGIGRATAGKNSIISGGNGIRIIQETLAWLNQNYPAFQGSVRIIDLKDDLNSPSGTMVKIHLYSKYQQH